MKTFRPILLGIFLLIAVSCKEDPPPPTEPVPGVVTTFYLVRHAEKVRTDPDDIDPELTQAGLGRAMHWAEILKDVPLDAIYSTDFARTSMTAAPAAVKQNITVQYYDPDTIDIEQFKMDSAGKNVFVVGHSNTTPELANQLLGESRFGPMDDSDNGSLFIIHVIGEQATATRLRFNCNCPD